ncbi:MAG TPA: thiamine pyrophosphate-dependent enzyme, partial [archaeon]|nr:thiamine pyrophosphate-dependent enzyme [archaeon]
MPEKILKTFQVKYVQVMDENGNVDQTMMPKITPDVIKKIYEGMILTKIFDETALSLQREGRMLTFATARGQEAQIIPAFVLRKSDWVVPAFRENGIMIALGYPMEMLYQYWSGDEAGMKVPDGMNCLPAAIPVSTQVAHAMGVAWAEKLKKTDSVVVSYSGDGSTSKSDFHEALNFAGVFKVPLIHIIQNNQWAISVPRSKQTAAETLAQKAIAYGFEGVQVDGNDVFAMYKVISEAVEKARKGGGPTLVEMYTYRLG